MPAASELMPDNVAEHLRANDTRASMLEALEALPPPVPREMALAAAPSLVDVAVATEDRRVLEQCGLLLARLIAEAAPDPSDVYGAAFGGERFAAYLAPRLIVKVTKRALGTGSREGDQQLMTREDAYSFACLQAWAPPAVITGMTAPEVAAGRTVMESMRIVREPNLFLYFPSFPS